MCVERQIQSWPCSVPGTDRPSKQKSQKNHLEDAEFYDREICAIEWAQAQLLGKSPSVVTPGSKLRVVVVAPHFPHPISRLLPYPAHTRAWHGEGTSSRGPPFCPHLCGLLLNLLCSQFSSDTWQALLDMVQSGVEPEVLGPTPLHSAPCLGQLATCWKRELRVEQVLWWSRKAGEG